MANEKDLLTQASYLAQEGADDEQGTKGVANILKGGQLGGGFDARYLDEATPLALTPAVPVVIHTPTMYDDKKQIGRMIKQIIETQAKTITGIDFGYTLETEDGPAFHDGQVFAIPTKATRTAVTPSFTFNELTGNLVWELFSMWVKDIQDPDTNAAMQHAANTESIPENAFVMSSYSMSMMVLQFDQTMLPQNLIAAAFYTNMFPTDPGGTLGLERTVATTNVPERTVEMTGIVQHNETIRKLGVELAEKLQLRKVQFSVGSANIDQRSQNPTPSEYEGSALEGSGLSQEAKNATQESE